MNGFEKYNITYTSPSQLNMWEECPAAWMAKYVYGYNFSFGVAPLIGILVEDVVVNVLTERMTFEQALELAHTAFDKKLGLNTSEKDLARKADIEQMAQIAIEELLPYGKPDFPDHGKQHKIELTCNGDNWKLPIIGYMDLVYPDEGLVVDLKTTLRIPTVMSDSHARQGAIYKKASGNKAMRFLYVSPKKSTWHDIENENETLAEIKTILNRQEKALRLDHETLRDVIPLNTSSYYWTGDEAIRKEVYGI